ncbi:MAG TPA: hypothetical protein VNO43_02920, partial [Candidatus Eisenbacteria bacterium]|nr:hypothetical protein [Candidatus Eisenbacteria bacterium]
MRRSARLFLAIVLFANHAEAADAQRTEPGESLHRPEDQRRGQPWTLWLYNRPLSIGAEWQTELVYERDFTLGIDRDELLRLDHELALEFSYPVTKNVLLYFEGIGFQGSDLYAPGQRRSSDGGFELAQLWVYFRNPFGSNFALRIGRQAIWEDRNWWWDDDLNAVRLFYRGGVLNAEIALANADRLSTASDDGSRGRADLGVLGRVEWEWA